MTLTTEDYTALDRLFARLAYNLDRGADEEYAADYTDDGSFEVKGIPEEAEHKGKHEGRDRLAEFIRMLFAGTQGHCRHWNHNFVFVREEKDAAEIVSYLQVLRVGQAPTTGVILTGVYTDSVMKVDGHWLLHRRVFTADPQTAWSDAAPTDVLVALRDEHVLGD